MRETINENLKETDEQIKSLKDEVILDFQERQAQMAKLHSGVDQMILELKRQTGTNMSELIRQQADENDCETQVCGHEYWDSHEFQDGQLQKPQVPQVYTFRKTDNHPKTDWLARGGAKTQRGEKPTTTKSKYLTASNKNAAKQRKTSKSPQRGNAGPTLKRSTTPLKLVNIVAGVSRSNVNQLHNNK